MYDFSQLTKFRLARGSHRQPNPTRGVCLNEAALIAGGFKYRAIDCAEDMPDCFSRVISDWALGINDEMGNHLRNELLIPFVLRLAGTADGPDVEDARYEFICTQTARRVISFICLELLNRTDLAALCDVALNKRDVQHAMRTLICESGRRSVSELANRAYMSLDWFRYQMHPRSVLNGALFLIPHHERELFTIAVEILDEAIRLGNHHTIEDIPLANRRLESIT